MLRLAIVLTLAIALCAPAPARDTDGLSQRLTPAQRDWVRGLRDHKGVSCCDTADGYDVPWEAGADGKYRVQIDGAWIDVPADALLDDRPNLIGVARVWYWRQDGAPQIRCFLPGSGS